MSVEHSVRFGENGFPFSEVSDSFSFLFCLIQVSPFGIGLFIQVHALEKIWTGEGGGGGEWKIQPVMYVSRSKWFQG